MCLADSWSGASEVITAMTEHGYTVRLSQSPFGWAEFCRSQVSHSRSGSDGATTPPRRGERFGLRRWIRSGGLKTGQP
jgi:hypothetical protein